MIFLKAYKKLMGIVAELEKIITSAVLVVVTILTFVNVLVRYLSDGQFAWSEELCINLFILLIMMGCGLQARDGSLISLSLVFDFLNVTGKKIFVAIITVANCAFCGILVKTGIDKVITQMANGKKTPSLMIPEWMFTIFLPIGAVFLILHTIEYCIDVWTNNAACVKPTEE